MATNNQCNVAVIDLEDFPGQSRKMIEACEELGCFRITNHHQFLPPTLSVEMKAVIRSLFDLPVEIKRGNTDVISGSGYKAPSQINPHYEAFGLYDIASHEAVNDFCSLLNASPHQRETIQMYAQAIHKLAMDIASKLAQGMGLASFSFEGWPCQFRINKYNFSPETVNSSGVQIHTDSGFLTILQEDENVGGLEVMDKSGTFVAMEPLPGTLLVNLGDTAKVWSNGRLCNVKHRVVCKEPRTRMSIASFLLGPKEAKVEAPAELVDSSHQRLYIPFFYLDYRNLRISKELQAGEALDFVRANSEKEHVQSLIKERIDAPFLFT